MNKRLNILELFAGSRSIGKIAEQRGHNVFSVDIKPFDGINHVCDIESLSADDVPFIPDLVHSGTPCTTYSIAAISHHRPTNGTISDFAKKCDRMNVHVWSLIDEWSCLYYIENPRGMLRKMPFMSNRDRATISYCQYRDDRMKPTDIWSNNIRTLFNDVGEWIPRPMCYNGNEKCHHERAPRGSSTGTQGRANNYERSKMPKRLCLDLIIAAEKRIANDSRPFETKSIATYL